MSAGISYTVSRGLSALGEECLHFVSSDGQGFSTGISHNEIALELKLLHQQIAHLLDDGLIGEPGKKIDVTQHGEELRRLIFGKSCLGAHCPFSKAVLLGWPPPSRN